MRRWLLVFGLLAALLALPAPPAASQIPVTIPVFTLAARTVTLNSGDLTNPINARGVLLYLNVTAASGTTPTLDVKVQHKDSLQAIYVDVPGGAFTQKTGAITDTLVVYPGIAVTANRQVSATIGAVWRIVATIGGTTPSFTFSVTADYIP